MSAEAFPVEKWGKVLRELSSPTGVQAVRIDPLDGSLLILTHTPEGEFDTWVESAEDVREYLATLEVDWAG